MQNYLLHPLRWFKGLKSVRKGSPSLIQIKNYEKPSHFYYESSDFQHVKRNLLAFGIEQL